MKWLAAVSVIVAIACASLFAADVANPLVKPKVTVRQDGKIQGMWVDNDKCIMAVISANADIPESFNESMPYVAVYVKDASGKLPPMPHAMNFQNGELQLQIPSKDSKFPRVVSLRRITALLDAVEHLNDAARH